MKQFKDISVKYKIIVIIIALVMLALTIGNTIQIMIDTDNHKQELVARTKTISSLMSELCAGPLTFGQDFSARAEEFLQTLRQIPKVSYCAILDEHGDFFAHYAKDDTQISVPEMVEDSLAYFENDMLHMYRPIMDDRAKLGTIYLQVQSNLSERISQHIWITLLIAAGLIAFTTLIAAWSQKIISAPILKLAQFTGVVSEHGDYSLKIPKTSEDEIGLLYDSFNHMLRQIQLRETARDEAEQKMRKSEARFREIFEKSLDLAYKQSLSDLTYEYMSPSAVHVMGFTAEEMRQMGHKAIEQRFFPKDLNKFHEHLNELLNAESKTMTETIIEYRWKHKDGTYHWYSDNMVVTYDNENNPLAIIGIIRDISDQKEAEKAVRLSEARLNMALSAVNDALWDWNIETGEIYFSPRYYTMLGYEPGEFPNLYQSWVHLLHPDDAERAQGVVQNHALERGDSFAVEFRLRQKDDSWKWILGRGQVIETSATGEPTRMIGTHVDISQLKKAEEDLRESEAKFKKLFENINVCVALHEIITDEDNQPIDFKFLDINATYEEHTKLERDKIIGKRGKEVIPHMEDKWLERYGKVAMTGEPFSITDYSEYMDKYWDIRAYSPMPRQFAVAMSDVTDRVKSDMVTRENEEKFSTVYESSPIGILLFDHEAKLFDSNPKGVESLGIILDDIVGKFDLKTEIISNNNANWEKLKNGDSVQQIIEYNFDNVTYNTSKRGDAHFHNIVTPVFGISESIGFIVQLIDITDLKRAEKELQRMAKMESLGILAGGIAHNFKNILANVMMNLSLAKFKPFEAGEYFEKIERAIAQASALATRFQTFSSGGSPIIEPIDVRQVISDALDLALSGSSITSKLDYEDGLNNILGDEKQLNEVFMNLIVNARQAMLSGGNILIKGNNIELEPGNHLELEPGYYVKISFEDNGKGIPRRVLNKIFDPFFTTKQDGHGLGLSSVQFILQKHGGRITADSETGQWTRFEIYMPATQKSSIHNPVEEEVMDGANKNILFMDDEELIRVSFSELGTLINYNIDTAADGYEAVSKYKERLDTDMPYDAVILDLTIQGSDMQGEDVLNALKEVDKNVVAIVFSGHSTKPIVANYKEFGFAGRLDKPASIERLSNVLHDVFAKMK